MRVLLLLLPLAGCPIDAPTGAACTTDGDCSGDVCTRDGLCTAPADVRAVKITWTVSGMAASAQSCTGKADLFVQFDGDSALDYLGFAPVPCAQGVFSVDKLPTRYRTVELGIDGGVGDRASIDASNTAHFDLFP